jgi:hypothetical protein
LSTDGGILEKNRTFAAESSIKIEKNSLIKIDWNYEKKYDYDGCGMWTDTVQLRQ